MFDFPYKRFVVICFQILTFAVAATVGAARGIEEEVL